MSNDDDDEHTAATPERRHHFIPFRRAEIVRRLIEEAHHHDETRGERFDEATFVALSDLLRAVFHFEFHEQLEQMKRWYAPFNPDASKLARPARTQAELAEHASLLAGSLEQVLQKCNYRRLSTEDVDGAKHHGSLIDLRVEVDFDEFAELVLYARGDATTQIEKKRWWRLKPKVITAPVYDRVCLYVRFQPEGSGKRRRTSLAYTPGTTILKLFREIPCADLEMLFPNCSVRMRLRDKIVLGVPALVGGVPVLLKLGPALFALGVVLGLTGGSIATSSWVPMIMAFAVLGGFLFRQWDKFRSRKVMFLKVLSENLYFRNLDNNEGVLTHLVDAAEEEESKEALLAYAFLLWTKDPIGERELDARIERWFVERMGAEVDFEIEDALAKLERYGLLVVDDEGRYDAVGLDTALERLDTRWDNYFRYAGQGASVERPAAESMERRVQSPEAEAAETGVGVESLSS